MKSTEKFILMSSDEFRDWLNGQDIHRPVRCIQNYYTILPAYARFTGSNHFQILSGMEEYQSFEKGYDEIGQNLTVFPDGSIAVCRDLNKIPAGKNGSSAFCLRVEHILNTGNEKKDLPEAQLDSSIWLNAILCLKFRINAGNTSIVTHPRSALIAELHSRPLAAALTHGSLMGRPSRDYQQSFN